jgi:hypothetical protein
VVTKYAIVPSVSPMNPEVKVKWTEALRSGKYEQGKGNLKKVSVCSGETKATFCCLGVLTDLYIEEHSDSAVWVAPGGDYPADLNTLVLRHTAGLLEDAVMRWAGLNSPSPSPFFVFENDVKGDQNNSFIGLNDSTDNLTFPQIADIIEWAL